MVTNRFFIWSSCCLGHIVSGVNVEALIGPLDSLNKIISFNFDGSVLLIYDVSGLELVFELKSFGK